MRETRYGVHAPTSEATVDRRPSAPTTSVACDLVAHAAGIAIGHARGAAGAPAHALDRAVLADLGALLARRLDELHVLQVARDADAVVDAVVGRAQPLEAPAALRFDLDPAHERRIDREHPLERAHLRELAGASRQQHVRRQLIRREAHLVEHQHAPPGARERRRHRAACEARSDDDDVELLHLGSPRYLVDARSLHYPE